LNGSNMTFRAKDPDHALAQLVEITTRYPRTSVAMADNIMSQQYFGSFVPKLAELSQEIDLFYEMKSDIRNDQLALMSKVGIRTIQPGIESLSTSVLQLMKKGTTGIQNVQLLKWCREYGIDTVWNLLWGFPGEDAGEYQIMAKAVRDLTHLQAPSGYGRIRVDRFSPNFRNRHELFDSIKPANAYYIVYPLGDEQINELAYYFDFSFKDQPWQEYTKGLVNNLSIWERRQSQDYLFTTDLGDRLVVFDTRWFVAPLGRVQVLRGAEVDIIRLGDGITSL
jgi:ribosomal peptide maturation radical SAM protein 1